MKKKNILLAIIFLSSSLLFILVHIYYNKVLNHQPIISETKVVPSHNDNKTDIPSEDELKLKEINKLYETNSDLFGWLTVEGTNIDYPVMYTQNDDYYLHRDFYQRYFKAGSLFIDKHNTTNPRDTNIIIHGHSMKDGSMFHDLLKYKDVDYYLEHKYITLYTLKAKEIYEVIGVIISEVYNNNDNVFKYYQFYNATNSEEYDNYIKNIKEKSIISIDTTSKFNGNLITLSTCEYSKDNSRLAVIAKKIN